MKFRIGLFGAVLLVASKLAFPQHVTVRVDAAHEVGRWGPVWAYFGYDEPNYTYAPNGKKLIGELAQLSASPVQIRTHHLLTTGKGEAAPKIGSTNVYRQGPNGNPIYDWNLLDRIFDTYVHGGVQPFVEIGFMPEALSAHPQPYTPVWSPGESFDHYFTGWTFPPKDYAQWETLVRRFVEHLSDRYGRAAVEKWRWEVWNEPNIAYWHGTAEEYDELYDYTAAAVKTVLPEAQIGGPASTGPANARAADFLRQFLKHCAEGKNAVTGTAGSPLDFISFHVKGRPQAVGRSIEMGISDELKDALAGFRIVRASAKFNSLPVILTEADPEGCAACSAKLYAQNAYRNGTLYASYEAAAMKALVELAATERVNLQGILTWAFEFEDQPIFAGFRDLATDGIDKPVLNLFRMLGLMNGRTLVAASSDAAVTAETMLRAGVREHADVDALAVRSENAVQILVWNYMDTEAGQEEDVGLPVSGLPVALRRVLVQHFRIDRDHSNAYTMWQEMGSPQTPTARQYAVLERSGQLQMLTSPHWLDCERGSLQLHFSLPPQAISLITITW
jgi:xylan 1,4-beta-xylosidase